MKDFKSQIDAIMFDFFLKWQCRVCVLSTLSFFLVSLLLFLFPGPKINCNEVMRSDDLSNELVAQRAEKEFHF